MFMLLHLAMFEMMKKLTLFTKDIARTREHDRNRNAYGLRPYWNNQRGPIDENRQNPRRNEPTKDKNVNICEEPEEEPESFEPKD